MLRIFAKTRTDRIANGAWAVKDRRLKTSDDGNLGVKGSQKGLGPIDEL
jgi:hypothetical protein